MKKKQVKKQLNKKVSMTDNQFGVILEDISNKFDILAEGQKSISKELGEFKDEMYSFRDEMYSFREDMLRFKDDTEKSLKTIAQYLSIIDDEIKSIKKELNKKSDIKEFMDLKNRLGALESEVLSLRKLVLQR